MTIMSLKLVVITWLVGLSTLAFASEGVGKRPATEDEKAKAITAVQVFETIDGTSTLPSCLPSGPREQCYAKNVEIDIKADSSLNLPAAAKFTGEFVKNVPHGLGTAVFDNGSLYVGEFEDGTFDGIGRFDYSDGRKHVGEWVAGVRLGYGVLYSPRNEEAGKGYWIADRLDPAIPVSVKHFPVNMGIKNLQAHQGSKTSRRYKSRRLDQVKAIANLWEDEFKRRNSLHQRSDEWIPLTRSSIGFHSIAQVKKLSPNRYEYSLLTNFVATLGSTSGRQEVNCADLTYRDLSLFSWWLADQAGGVQSSAFQTGWRKIDQSHWLAKYQQYVCNGADSRMNQASLLDIKSCDNQATYYPRQSRLMREAGTVVVEVEIKPSGEIHRTDIRLSSGYERLDKAALEWISTCKSSSTAETGRDRVGTVEIQWKAD
jgi:TonB family protein